MDKFFKWAAVFFVVWYACQGLAIIFIPTHQLDFSTQLVTCYFTVCYWIDFARRYNEKTKQEQE